MKASIGPGCGVKRAGAPTLGADRRAASMLEYGMIAGLIAVVCVTALNNVGFTITTVLDDVQSSFHSALGG